MDKLEKIEKLRERAQVSYDEAREVLEQTDGDLLDAIILLERQGKVHPPQGGGYYRSQDSSPDFDLGEGDQEKSKKQARNEQEGPNQFKEALERIGAFVSGLIKKGNSTSFEILKEKEHVASFPVTVLAVLLLFIPYITLPAIVVGLFLGYHYQFVSNDN